MPDKSAENTSAASRAPLSRRRFLRAGAMAGTSVAAVATGAQAAPAGKEIVWDREVDIVVIGAGASGLPASIAARDQGAEVMVVDHHFDIGGIAIMSGGDIRIGGGNRLQKAAGSKETADDVFKQWTHPLRHRFADADLVRRFADENVATFDFLEANGVNFDRPDTEVPKELQTGVTKEGMRPHEWPIRTDKLALDQGRNGSGIVRPLELSARDKGVEFMLSHTLRAIHREQPFAGRVLGVTIEQVDRWFQPQSRFLNIRARKAVVLCSGGHGHNVHFRRMFDPRLTDEYQHHGQSTAPANAAGEIAAMQLGAALWSCGNETDTGVGQAIDKGRLAVRDNYVRGKIGPESAVFFRHRALGLDVRDWQDLILVKENGLRFYNELDKTENGYFSAALKPTYHDPNKLNGGGPIWAIFDSAGVEREKWQTVTPHVDRAGGYFFSAATLEELAAQLTRNIYQKRPMPADALKKTVERFNSFVVSGKDEDFNRPSPPFKIEKPPFYAAWATPCLHDSYTGLRTNTNCQVMDMQGKLIPGLFCAGETQGGIKSHGLGRCIVTGRVAGMEAARSA